MVIITIIFCCIATIFLCELSPNFGKKLRILDFPDKKRKFHKKPIPQTGGIILFVSIIINYFFSKNLNYNLFFLIWISFFFLLGFFDDRFKINWTVKFIIPFFFLFFFLNTNNHFFLNEFNFDFLKKIIIIKKIYYLNYFFTILCVLLLFNAINMIDGHNGICLIYFIYCAFLLIFQNNINLNEVLITVLPSVLIVLYYNINNRIFLGNSGSFIISSVLSYYFITNNNYYNKISIEKIFLILAIPGLDMLRLFISRIINNNNPFHPDRNHLHHLLFKNKEKYNLKYIFYFFIMFIPGVLGELKIFNNFYLIVVIVFFYTVIIINLKKDYKFFLLK